MTTAPQLAVGRRRARGYKMSTYLVPSTSVCAFVSNVLRHRFSSFSGTATALFTLLRAAAVREVGGAPSASQWTVENIRGRLNGNIASGFRKLPSGSATSRSKY